MPGTSWSAERSAAPAPVPGLVRGTGSDHTVSGATDAVLTCTCPWAESQAAGRGPCKHVLAVLLTADP